jgi:hypothetical protein
MTLSATTIDEPMPTKRSGVQPSNWYGVIFARGGLDSLLIGEIYQKGAMLACWVLGFAHNDY